MVKVPWIVLRILSKDERGFLNPFLACNGNMELDDETTLIVKDQNIFLQHTCSCRFFLHVSAEQFLFTADLAKDFLEKGCFLQYFSMRRSLYSSKHMPKNEALQFKKMSPFYSKSFSWPIFSEELDTEHFGLTWKGHNYQQKLQLILGWQVMTILKACRYKRMGLSLLVVRTFMA